MTDNAPPSITEYIDASSLEDYLRQFLEHQREDEVTDTIIAHQTMSYLSGRGDVLIRDIDGFWISESNGNGMFRSITEEEMCVWFHDLEGARMQKGRFEHSATRARRIVKVIGDYKLSPGYFASAPEGIAVNNGFLTVRDKQIVLEKLSPEHRQRAGVSLSYSADVSTVMIDGFMAETLQDPDVVDFCYEIVGATLFGKGGSMQKLVILHGGGGNGKGVFTRLIRMLLPAKTCAAIGPADMSMDYQRYKLYGALANMIGELPALDKKSLEWYKTFTGGDAIFMRSIGKNGFDYQPIAMHIISTNQLPQLPKVDDAIKRRMIVVPFNNTVTENNVIVDFEKQLYVANGEGLLLRAVQGYQRVIERGGKLDVPDAVRRATDAWLRPYDGVRLFAAECLEEVADNTARITATEMHDRCREFCIDRGLHMPTSPKDLHMQLAELGFQSGKSSNTYWYGIRFKG